MGGRSSPLPGLPEGLRLQALALLVLLLFVGGCQRIGLFSSGAGQGGREEAAPGSGTVYQGFLVIDGGRVPAALEIIGERRRTIRGILQTSEGVRAQGEGRIRGETLSLELTYGGRCPGQIDLEGDWDRDSHLYEGELTASDCTGTARGTFRFSAS